MENKLKKLISSLDIVGEYYGDIKEACTDGFFTIETDRLSAAKEVMRCIKMYSLLKSLDDPKEDGSKVNKLAGKKLEVLVYYLLYGYNSKTKKEILKTMNMTDSNLNNINHSLRKLGVIKNVGYNSVNNDVDEELLMFKNFIVDNKGKYVMIKIK